MRRSTVFVMAVALCAALCAVALAGCGGGASSSTASSAPSSSAASDASASSMAESAAAASTLASTAAASSVPASSSATSSSGALINIDGVDVKKVELEMVGSTPNLQVVFSNSTDKPIEVDCGKFEVKLADGTVVDFAGSTKTIDANQPYTQWAFTAKADTMKAGDKATVSYGGTELGEFEVGEF